ISRVGLTTSLKPWDLAVLRFGIGGLVLLPVLVRSGFRGIAMRDAVALAFTGGLGFAACAYAGFALAPASHGAVLLHGTLPLSTYVLARAWGTGASGAHTSGLPFIALGVGSMGWEGVSAGTPLQWVGDAALLLASVSWAGYGLLVRRVGLPPAHCASIVAVLSMASFVPAFLALSWGRYSVADWHGWLLQALFQGLLVGAVSIYVYSTALARLGPERTALLTASVPCVTTLGSVVFLHESVSATVLVGIALVTTGTLVSLFGRGRWRRILRTPE
ncbi:MAG TPA: DMT family transporter, partial [Burkholderiaceae bacterium]|nr:DMT family transporter [Burkholderiaceae bacterium]